MLGAWSQPSPPVEETQKDKGRNVSFFLFLPKKAKTALFTFRIDTPNERSLLGTFCISRAHPGRAERALRVGSQYKRDMILK